MLRGEKFCRRLLGTAQYCHLKLLPLHARKRITHSRDFCVSYSSFCSWDNRCCEDPEGSPFLFVEQQQLDSFDSAPRRLLAFSLGCKETVAGTAATTTQKW